jgi:glutamate dehydrogenase/leucine dehydrogenase
MEVKFSVSGPVGGAKSGINFDRMTQEKRCFTTAQRASISFIESYYGTGGDLNVDEIHEVIPLKNVGLASAEVF